MKIHEFVSWIHRHDNTISLYFLINKENGIKNKTKKKLNEISVHLAHLEEECRLFERHANLHHLIVNY
jgi:hypothetical protein